MEETVTTMDVDENTFEMFWVSRVQLEAFRGAGRWRGLGGALRRR